MSKARDEFIKIRNRYNVPGYTDSHAEETIRTCRNLYKKGKTLTIDMIIEPCEICGYRTFHY